MESGLLLSDLPQKYIFVTLTMTYVSDVIVINTCSFQISLGLHIKHTKVIIFLLE